MNIAQQEILKQAKLEDFPNNAKEFINAIGVDASIELFKLFGGNTIYIPTLDRTLMPIRNKIIRAKHKRLIENGCGGLKAIKELSQEYGLTNSKIYCILSEDNK